MMGLDLLVSDLDNTAPYEPLRSLSFREGNAMLEQQNKQIDTVSPTFSPLVRFYPLPHQVLLTQESCKLAVEICDDLLNYEAFEDDDLPLVIKTLPAALLFHEIAQPFQVQV
jgi:hypothetical protein